MGWEFCCIKVGTARQWKKRLLDNGGLYETGVGRRQKRHTFHDWEDENPEKISYFAKIDLRNEKKEHFLRKMEEVRARGIRVTIENMVAATGLSYTTVWRRLRLCGLRYRRERVVSMITDKMKVARMRMARQQLILMAKNELQPDEIWFTDECSLDFTGAKVKFPLFGPSTVKLTKNR